MSDSATDVQPITPPAEAPKTEDRAEHMIPKSRFDEVNTELQKMRDWRAKQEKDAQREKDAAAAQRGEFEKLATDRATRIAELESQHSTASAELDALRAEIDAELKPRIKALPEALRDLVPADGTPAQRLAAVRKLETAAASLTATIAPRGTLPGPRGTQATATVAADDILNQKRARFGG